MIGDLPVAAGAVFDPSLYYIFKHPPTPVAEEAAAAEGPEDDKPRIQIAGAFALCPMVKGRYSATAAMLIIQCRRSQGLGPLLS